MSSLLHTRRRRVLALVSGAALTTVTAVAAQQAMSSAAPGQGTGTAGAKATPKPSATSPGNGGGNSGNGGGNGGGDGSLSENKSFTIAGDVADLAPGVASSLQLSLTNGAPQPMRISSLRVQASDVRTPAGTLVCGASNLLLGPDRLPGAATIAVSLVVEASSTRTGVAFPVVLAPSATNECKGVTWKLSFSGTGAQA